MKRKELYKIRQDYLNKHHPYRLIEWDKYDYSILSNIMYRARSGRGSNTTYNDVIIMADTETSKKAKNDIIDYDFIDIKKSIKSKIFKYNKSFKDVASIQELKSVGISMAYDGVSKIDTYYEELCSSYPHIFYEVMYNDIDCLQCIYDYLDRPEVIECNDNHVVAFAISLRAFGRNLVTLYGHKPSDFVSCIDKIMKNMNGQDTIIYFHNLSYDWVFLRKFIMRKYGTPDKQLNTKSHYPIYIKWDSGLILKDSLILAQRSLEKWAKDMDVEHQKAKGLWDYDKIRSQYDDFSKDELEYIEHDTLAGVECIDKLMLSLGKYLFSLPYTATGIPREQVRTIGKVYNAKDAFNRMALSYEQYLMAENVYHGGYTHANRHLVNQTIEGLIQCKDFASSYPYSLLAFKYPMERFTICDDCSIESIINDEDYAYMFKLILYHVSLKDDFIPMPPLQYSKCIKTINAVLDNGRILCADYVEIYITELDAAVINDYYKWDKHLCTSVYSAYKTYLPRWLTDYIYQLFVDKTQLKGGDPVAYALAKSKLNSIYGMMVQKSVKINIDEDYTTGEYIEEDSDPEELYAKYLTNYNSILPYQWGVWCTAYAFYNLFQLGVCCETWIYSDTDSCYGIGWNEDKVEAYNNRCKQRLIDNNYDPVVYNGREYWLGVAEDDASYSQYRVQGAKRYCGRSVEDGQLHITVAGVPKVGAVCLKDDINNFKPGLIFSGQKTGKKTHKYIYVDDIYIDEEGNETGDSIDLSTCDYLLDGIEVVNWRELFVDDVEIQVYEEI